MTGHLNTFRKQFRLDPELDLETVQLAVEAIYEAQAIGFAFLSEVAPPSPKDGFRIHAFLNLMSRIYEHGLAMLVSLATGSPANRLGLDALLLMGNDVAAKLSMLEPDTVNYFKRLPGYDTLRIVLANKIVLVEGPSDEIVFERIFQDVYGKRPMECGIDVLSMRGLSLARGLELCAALNKPITALRDNDGVDPAELRAPVDAWLKKGEREIFIGEVAHGETLEPQLIHHNDETLLRDILGIAAHADLLKWMTREKTEAALRISAASKKIVPPAYMLEAVKFAHG